SGFASPLRLDDPATIGATLAAHWELPAAGGVLVANPIPETDAMEYGEIEAVIERAVGEAEERGIHGKEVTPFLLARIVELTGGASLEANIALVKSNARLAAEIAGAVARA
ncbi:MAG TPA: pseudouridine-5'-phosphate glycosidase, partial [Alkalispirochaeta sp.]|nr:pseudouridine-5'-phosphate glycosidase [Alkalispirochaeta sp.]